MTYIIKPREADGSSRNISFSLANKNMLSNKEIYMYRVLVNDLDKVNKLKTFFWLAIIILIIFFIGSYLVHFDNRL